MRCLSLLPLVAVALIACLGATVQGTGPGEQIAATKVEYQVVDVGTLPDGRSVHATSVNDSGWVVGYSYTTSGLVLGHYSCRPFLWRDGMMKELTDLGGEHGQAWTLNADGDIGGNAEKANRSEMPVLWHATGGQKVEALSRQPGDIKALLADGLAVGTTTVKRQRLAACWLGGKCQVLGNLQDEESAANDVNRAGTAVGFYVPNGGLKQSAQAMGDRHAAVWQDGQQIALPELGALSLIDKNLAGFGFSDCEAINEDGIAVGWSDGPQGKKACVWKAGKVVALPGQEGNRATAHSINKSGAIVGMASPLEPEKRVFACLWRADKQVDLNTLIPPDSGWTLLAATHISDKGLIVGYGVYDKFPKDARRAFLLIPVKP